MSTSSRSTADGGRRVHRPSPLVRWPLHLLNGILTLTGLALVAVCALFVHLDLEPPWGLAAVGGAICLLLMGVNTTVIRLRLVVDEGGAELRAFVWRRRIPWDGCELERIERPVGVVAVRLLGADGRRLWIGAGWFRDFPVIVEELEQRVSAAGGAVRACPR